MFSMFSLEAVTKLVLCLKKQEKHLLQNFEKLIGYTAGHLVVIWCFCALSHPDLVVEFFPLKMQ